MTHVIYRGLDNTRTLSAPDVKVDGFTKTTFEQGVPTEVSQAVAEKLSSNPKIFGDFELVADAAPVEEPAEADLPRVEDEPIDLPTELPVEKPARKQR